MNILLLEDDGIKIRTVSNFLEENGHKCTVVTNIMSMKKTVAEQKYEMVLVDLRVPYRAEDEEVIEYNGYEAISYLRTTTDTIFYPKSVIALSRFMDDETIIKLNSMGTTGIKYEEKNNEWKEKLKTELEYTSYLSVKKADIAIMTVVDNEKNQINKIFKWEKMNIQDESLQFYSCKIRGNNDIPLTLIHCHVAKMGMVASTYATAKIFELFEPDCIIMVGIAGGRKNKVNAGDIVLAETAVDYASGSIEEDDKGEIWFYPDSDEISMKPLWTKCFKDYREDKNLLRQIKDQSDLTEEFDYEIKLHIGKMATGPDVIKSEKFANDYIKKHHRQYIAVDMETYGVYHVARNYPCVYMSIKSISDSADKHKNDLYQKYAALIAANMTKHYILNDYKKNYRV